MKGTSNTDGRTDIEKSVSSGQAGPIRRLLWSVPLGWQLSALYTFLLVATLSVVGVLVYTQQQDFLVQDAAVRLEKAATDVLTQSQHFGQDGGPQQGFGGQRGEPRGNNSLHLDMLLGSLGGRDVTVAVLDPRGKIITSTQSLSGGSTPLVDPVTSAQASAVMSSGQPLHWIARHVDGSRYVVALTSIATPLSAEFDTATAALLNSSTTHLLEQSESLAAADAALSRLGTYLLLGVIGGTLAGLILGTTFTRGILRPLDRVADTAEAIAGGDLQRRLQLPGGRNEVARLGKAFDYMVGRLVTTLEAQKRFVADASHELRTPLTSLKGLAEILVIGAHGNDSRVIEQSAGAINSELDRLIRLVTDLLTLSRFDNARSDGALPMRRSHVDVCATIESAVTQMAGLAEAKEVRMAAQCDGAVSIIGDAGQLKQVLLNLLDNALRHTPVGGEVRLSAEVEQAQRPTDTLTARIEVQDTGTGIDPKELPHIFERFYRGDVSRTRATGNTGLGLAIVNTIIEAHEGTIEVQSTPGAGTRFIIRLPLTGERVLVGKERFR